MKGCPLVRKRGGIMRRHFEKIGVNNKMCEKKDRDAILARNVIRGKRGDVIRERERERWGIREMYVIRERYVLSGRGGTPADPPPPPSDSFGYSPVANLSRSPRY